MTDIDEFDFNRHFTEAERQEWWVLFAEKISTVMKENKEYRNFLMRLHEFDFEHGVNSEIRHAAQELLKKFGHL